MSNVPERAPYAIQLRSLSCHKFPILGSKGRRFRWFRVDSENWIQVSHAGDGGGSCRVREEKTSNSLFLSSSGLIKVTGGHDAIDGIFMREKWRFFQIWVQTQERVSIFVKS